MENTTRNSVEQDVSEVQTCEKCARVIAGQWFIFGLVTDTFESVRRSPCSSCRMLASLAGPGFLYPLNFSRDGAPHRHRQDLEHLRELHGDAALCVKFDFIIFSTDHNKTIDGPRPQKEVERHVVQVRWPTGTDLPMPRPRMTVDRDCVQYSAVRMWLRDCQSGRHKWCCGRTPAFEQPPMLRLMDTETRIVGPAPNQARYIALSYARGATSSEGFPQVVLDSIEVARQLGYQYLWVDQYVCASP